MYDIPPTFGWSIKVLSAVIPSPPHIFLRGPHAPGPGPPPPGLADHSASSDNFLSGSDWELTSDDGVPPVPEPLPIFDDQGGPHETIFYRHHEFREWKLCTQTTAYASDPHKAAVGFTCHLHSCRPGLRAKRHGRIPSTAHIQRWLRDGLKEPNNALGRAKHMTMWNYLLAE